MDKGEKERRSVSTPREIYPLRLFSRGCTYESHGQHTHTHPFNGPLSRTTRVSRYQKCKTNLDFTEARNSERHWHQLGHMQVCTSLQTDNHASTPPLMFFTGRMPFLAPNQQRQSTEGTRSAIISKSNSQSNLCSKNCVLLFVICCGM